MKEDIRQTLIDGGPFAHLKFTCDDCGEDIFTLDDMEPGKHMRNEVYLRYKIDEHVRETGHISMSADIQPHTTLNMINCDITINDN